mgnify:CR=1 FL=1
MEHRERLILACGGIVGIFLVVQLGALAFVEPASEQGLQEVEGGGNPTLSLALVAGMLVATGVMLAALKYGGASLMRAFILLASVYIAFFALDVLAPTPLTPSLGGVTVNVIAVGGALGLGLALYRYPEWYVIDAAGVVMGVGAAGLFGLNFGILPAIVLLVVLAVYDAVSVYGTEHMLTLASGVMEMRVPVVLVVPLSLSYSFLDAETPETVQNEDGGDPSQEEDTDDETPDESDGKSEPAEPDDEPEALTAAELEELGPAGVAELEPAQVDALDPAVLDEVNEEIRAALREAAPGRDALFIGLGDAIIPTVLVASAAVFVDAGPELTVFGIPATLPAVTAMVGTLAGLVVLLYLVTRGRAHAGLPLLNGGAIAGYLVGALASGLTLAEALGLAGVL